MKVLYLGPQCYDFVNRLLIPKPSFRLLNVEKGAARPNDTAGSFHDPGQQAIGHATQHSGLVRRRTKAWVRWLISLALICSDALLAVVIWVTAYALQSIWGRGPEWLYYTR